MLSRWIAEGMVTKEDLAAAAEEVTMGSLQNEDQLLVTEEAAAVLVPRVAVNVLTRVAERYTSAADWHRDFGRADMRELNETIAKQLLGSAADIKRDAGIE